MHDEFKTALGCRIQDPGTRGYRWWKQPTFHTARAQHMVRPPYHHVDWNTHCPIRHLALTCRTVWHLLVKLLSLVLLSLLVESCSANWISDLQPPPAPKTAKKSQQIGGTNQRTDFQRKKVPSALDLSPRPQHTFLLVAL